MKATPELVRAYVAAVRETLAPFKERIPTQGEFDEAIVVGILRVVEIAPELADIRVAMPPNQVKPPLVVVFEYDGHDVELWKTVMIARMQLLEEQFATVVGIATGYRARLEQLQAVCSVRPGAYKSGMWTLNVHRLEGGGVDIAPNFRDVVSLDGQRLPVFHFDENGNNIQTT